MIEAARIFIMDVDNIDRVARGFGTEVLSGIVES